MDRSSGNMLWPRIRTIGFLVAMIPALLSVGALSFLVLILTSPLTLYAGIVGKHLGDPSRKGAREARVAEEQDAVAEHRP